MQAARPHLPWSVAVRSALPCVVCARPMDTLSLFEVPVDRCRAHGVWFDEHELAEVLRRSAAERVEEPRDRSLGNAFDAIDLGADTVELGAAVAVETGLDAGIEAAVEVGTSGIIEGILDVLGGIFSVVDL